uniref:Uncharacterized protein n=1 Tax=Nicotiana tabacum TaxID=4097 RepID=A0A1S4ANK3_TOBAC|nr:PREDICTED: uncharacterized protein LOC107799630 [Nicotiana tabacum]
MGLPRYNGTSGPNKHITAYMCAVKGNDTQDDEIESVLLKRFREMLSKGVTMRHHSLAPDPINSLTILINSLMKAHTGAIEATIRKPDASEIEQRENEMLLEFAYHSQMERMELPPVLDDWAMQAFTQSLNEQIPVISTQLKQNLIGYPAKTWSDALIRHQSQIRVVDDQMGSPSGSVYPSRLLAKKPMPNKERYRSYATYRRNAPRRNLPRYNRRMDRGQYPRGIVNRARFDGDKRPARDPHPPGYNFNIVVLGIVFTVSKIGDAKGPRPIQSNTSQRNHSLVCQLYNTHGHGAEDGHQLRRKKSKLLNKNHRREL